MTNSEKRCRKNRFLLACLLVIGLLWVPPASCQTDEAATKVLTGRTVEGELGIPDVHVLNLSQERATISDSEGAFRIRVRQGDTLLFSAIRYQKLQLIVSGPILQAVSLKIPLKPFVNELDEVVVSPYDLSGNLAGDMGKVSLKAPVSAISLGLPNARAKDFTPTENRLNEATTGGGIVPLNPLLNAITGRTRRLKKQLALERRYEKVQQWRELYSDSVIQRQLGIPLNRIEDFMYFCEVDEQFEPVADSGDRLRIWGFLRRKSLEYRVNNDLD